MSKLTITSRKAAEKLENGKTVYIVSVIVDTIDDLPKPESDWAPGSMCIIANSHDYRWLNNEREWV